MEKAAHDLTNCDSCDLETYHRTSLENHIEAVHKDTKKFACRICDYTSYHRHNLRCHHPDSQSRSFKRIDCTSCDLDKVHLKCFVPGRVTRVRRKVLNLKTTINIGEEENLLQYEECEYYGTRTDLLQSHIKSIHGRILRCSCAYCTYASFAGITVRHHLKHTHPSEELVTPSAKQIQIIPVQQKEGALWFQMADIHKNVEAYRMIETSGNKLGPSWTMN